MEGILNYYGGKVEWMRKSLKLNTKMMTDIKAKKEKDVIHNYER